MIAKLLSGILGAFFGNVGSGASSGVAKVIEWGAVIAAVPVVVQWLRAGGANEVMFTVDITYGLALVIVGAAWWSTRVTHRAPPPPAPWP